MLSSTPPSDVSHSDQETHWKTVDNKLNTKYTQDSGGGSGALLAPSDRHFSSDQQRNPDDYPVGNGHGHSGAGTEKHMKTNGIDRNKMTGSSTTTSENLTWLSESIVSQSPSQRSSSLSTLSSGHESTSMLSSSGPSLFRTPAVTDPSSRLFSPGHINPVYTTSTASTLSPYSPTMHTQSSHLATISPYGAAFYPQYSPGYSPSSLLSSHYPHIESYSAVLASMGSHVQHAQSHLPRTSFLPGHIPQYLSSHGSSLTPTNSPGPSMHRPMTSTSINASRPLTPSHVEHLRRDSKSPKSELKSEGHDPRSRQGRNISPSTRGHPLSPSQAQVLYMKSGQYLKKPLEVGELVKDPLGYKVPSGKEGSLKHRILTRPPDIHIEGSALGEGKHGTHQGIKSEEPSPKRHKGSIGHPPPLHSLSGGSGHGQLHLPPPPPLQPSYPNTPHYPPHFMRGSIIQLANGELKRVEDLRTDDFVHSADISGDLKIDSSTVVRIEEIHDRNTVLLSFSVGEHRVQVTVEATVEHPFFVFGQGWSSCRPQRTSQRYGLTCHRLSVGDVCISLTHRDVNTKAAELATRQPQDRTASESAKSGKQGSASASSTQVHQGTQMQSTETQTRGAVTQVEKTRKRRWSAPDQTSADSVVDKDTLISLSASFRSLGNHSESGGNLGSQQGSPQGVSRGSPHGSNRGSPPIVVNKGSPQSGNRGSPLVGSHGSPHVLSRGSPRGSPHGNSRASSYAGSPKSGNGSHGGNHGSQEEHKGNHGSLSDHNGNHGNHSTSHANLSCHDNIGKSTEKT
ncbi:ataxin-1-like [Lineus longissimus]|uniref:ataxin-1-like n=1 Tax=Lineus longissimus TaxID=88925 RepID=UPI002B4E3152